LNVQSRDNPDCVTEDCKTSFFPAGPESDLQTLRNVTGVEAAIMSFSSLASLTSWINKIDNGEFKNGRVIRTKRDLKDVLDDPELFGIVFYMQSRKEGSEYRLNGDVATLKNWFDAGLRIFQLAYDERDYQMEGEILAYGDTDPDNASLGVTELGFQAIEKLNEIGMFVDVSHLNVPSTLQAASYSSAPIICTHANTATQLDTMRNKTDEEIKAIVAAGGIIGVTPVKHFITKGNDPGVEDLIRHINHIRDLVGIDYVGLSKDAIVDGWIPSSRFYPGADLSRPDWMKVVALELYTKHGYTEEELKKVIGGNFMRVLMNYLPD
jgi:microsomal dipeptidase-like Zn-dependent dipeptidase